MRERRRRYRAVIRSIEKRCMSAGVNIRNVYIFFRRDYNERMRDEDRDRSAYEETTALVQELDELKQRGSNLLVVGSRMPTAHRAACQQFLGEASSEPRRRLFALADPSTSIEDRIPRTADPESLRVVRYAAESRSAAATQPTSQSDPIDETPIEHDDIGEFGRALSRAIVEFEAASGGLSPAELRLCFDSLTPLLSGYEPETVFRFLHLLTRRVRTVDGMGHYHLTTDRNTQTVALLEPLFDAVIELCLHDGTLHQRWYLRDRGLTTGWLQL